MQLKLGPVGRDHTLQIPIRCPEPQAKQIFLGHSKRCVQLKPCFYIAGICAEPAASSLLGFLASRVSGAALKGPVSSALGFFKP